MPYGEFTAQLVCIDSSHTWKQGGAMGSMLVLHCSFSGVYGSIVSLSHLGKGATNNGVYFSVISVPGYSSLPIHPQSAT